MLQHKAKLVFSSDWPACLTPDPIRGLDIAVNRCTLDGYPESGWVPEQRIYITEALKACTEAGAYSSFEEGIKGKITPDYLAVLIVCSADLFTIPTMDIGKANVILTIFDGKVIYQDESFKQ